MIENLTLAQKVIKVHTIDPLEKHTVVVLERIGDAGEEFRFAIEPGQRVPKKWLGIILDLMRGRTLQDKYFAFAVTGDPDLRVHVSERANMEDHVHWVMLNIDIGYTVTDPRMVVTSRRYDPVRKLREEAARLLQRDVSWRNWNSVRDNVHDVARDIVAANRDPLNRFASQYGFRVHDLDLALLIDDSFIIDKKTRATVTVQEEVHRVTSEFERNKMVEEARTSELRDQQTQTTLVRGQTHEHQRIALREVQELEREHVHSVIEGRRRLENIYNAATDAATTVLEKVADSINTPEQLSEALQSFYTAVGQTRALVEGETTGAEMAVDGRPPVRRITAGQSGVAAVIVDMLTNTERMPVEIATKHQLQSAILHLIAELMLNGTADAETVTLYGQRVADLRAHASLPVDQFDYLKRFADVDRLRAALC
ncbi:MAG: hypothetical protein QOI58_1661 [Thermoanaerobaculia bacterium]|jgi:hypothetical protein|nr:hypothetical protein [Thermoanaerobaculia bacterium]